MPTVIFENPGYEKKLLLHTCCAPCSPHVIKLLQEEFEVTCFFYNPNIYPLEEYQRRLEEMEQFTKKIGMKLIRGDYEIEEWFSLTQGLEREREGGKRCSICYRIRLEKTVSVAQRKGFSFFTTTLTVSPYKKATPINTIGRELQKKYSLAFYQADFKKADGFKKSCELSKFYNFYRQHYCGCIYSQRK